MAPSCTLAGRFSVQVGGPGVPLREERGRQGIHDFQIRIFKSIGRTRLLQTWTTSRFCGPRTRQPCEVWEEAIPSFLWCNPAEFAAPAQNKQDEKYRVRMGSYCANPLNPGPSLKETQFLRSNFFWIVENPAPFQASLKKGRRNLHFLVPLEHWARLKN